MTPATVKLVACAASGFFAGAAGVIWGVAWRDVSTDLLSPVESLALLVIPVVGGLGSIAGAIVATFVVFVPTFFVAPELTGLLGDFGRNRGFLLALSGAGLALTPRFHPGGVAGAAQHGWERFLATSTTRRLGGGATRRRTRLWCSGSRSRSEASAHWTTSRSSSIQARSSASSGRTGPARAH